MKENIDLKSLIEIKRKETQKSKEVLDSHNRLEKMMAVRIKTTMIGALAAIEKNFGPLWETEDGKPSEESVYLKQLFEATRKEILDNGNDQINGCSKDLKQFGVLYTRYHVDFSVNKREENE